MYTYPHNPHQDPTISIVSPLRVPSLYPLPLPMNPPVPSGSDQAGPFFVKSDIGKTKPYQSTSISIKDIPIGSQLRFDGPGPYDQPVLYKGITGEQGQRAAWECLFKKKYEKK